MTAPGDRITAVDTVRGFAVLGILVMNIVAFSMPSAAYGDPTVYGGAGGWDLAAWGAALVVADGKMRGLFTLLFGVSMAIVADAAERRGANPAQVHYRRMAWLMVIGMIHGLGIWYGDILVEYAVTGVILFVAWRWRPAALIYTAAVLFVADVALHADNWQAAVALQAAVGQSGASPAELKAWQAMLGPGQGDIARELAAYRGGLATEFTARLKDLTALTNGLPYYLIESVGTAALGIGLYRTGYFTSWPRSRHLVIIGVGLGLAVPAMAVAALLIVQHGLDPVARALASLIVTMLRPAILLGYASVLILAVESGRATGLIDRLAAAGRMALSNYLATSIVMTTLFYGHGLGWFGHFSRAELVPFVIAMWVAILAWSAPWLRRFRHGPAEWAWRSLARWEIQPFRRDVGAV